eukprot:822667-Pelagomonas_calceolata.AAC.3
MGKGDAGRGRKNGAQQDPKGLGEGHTQLQMSSALRMLQKPLSFFVALISPASARNEQASRLAYPPALLNIAGRSILTPPTKNQCHPPQHEAGGAMP